MVEETFWQIKKQLFVALVGFFLLLSGCSSIPLSPEVKAPAEPAEPVKIQASSPAYGLLTQAQRARQQGQTAVAGRFLERALTLAQPEEATVLYRELGELRLAEGKARAAEGMFMRALRDAPANVDWQAELWQQIESVRVTQGNKAGAAAAAEKIQQLQAL